MHLSTLISQVEENLFSFNPATIYSIQQTVTNTTTTETRIINRFTGALVVYSISLPPFLVLGFVVALLLIIRWKTMVFIKRCLYGLVVVMSCLQIVSITAGIMQSVCVLIGNKKECVDPFAAIQYSCGNLTVILCVFCFLTITRILYKVYFDKGQWWMRIVEQQEGSMGKTVPKKIAVRNQKFGKFVKWTAIISAVALLIIAPLHIATIMITSLTSLMPTVSSTVAASASYNRFFADAILALGYWFLIFFFGIINIMVGVSLTKKLGGEAEQNVSPQRKKACRQLNLLNALQLVFGGITGSIVIMAILTLVQYEIYIAGITVQRISIFFFAVALTFIYGPLDELDLKETKHEIVMATKKILPSALVDRKERIDSEESPRDDVKSTVADLGQTDDVSSNTPSPPQDGDNTPVQNQV